MGLKRTVTLPLQFDYTRTNLICRRGWSVIGSQYCISLILYGSGQIASPFSFRMHSRILTRKRGTRRVIPSRRWEFILLKTSLQSRLFYPTTLIARTGAKIRRLYGAEHEQTGPVRFGRCPQAIAPQTRLALKTPAILVAEDDSDSREMIKILLCSKGYAVIEAADGLQAVEVALTKLPDLILLDLQLPLLDGVRVTRNLRQHPMLRAVPIVVISGHDPNGHRQAALDAGCNDYL